MDPSEPVPDADAAEQAQPVETGDEEDERAVVRPAERGDVPEADWLEQSVAEPLDDDDER
ncbi:MAG TPA: hypothetical protein VMV22_14310 [Acidimicrobiales bacterium]|nr:hypothetical protein [Acidimicrobiales bacterium]